MSRRIRTSTRQSWDDEAMSCAIMSVIEDELPLREAARNYDVPRTTLQNKVKRYRENPDLELVCTKGLGSYHPVFNPIQESELVDYLMEQADQLYGLTSKELRILAYQIAEKNHIEHPFIDGIAGRDWMRGFLKRNPRLSLRKPENVSSYRARGFNKVVVNNFYDLLEEQMNLNQIIGIEGMRFGPECIFNVDETAVTVNPKSQTRILSQKGKRQVGKLCTSERGRHITATLCVSASGDSLPPFFIFSRKKMDPALMNGCTEGSWGEPSEKGWMTSELFGKWLRWFVEMVQPTKEKPVLLLLDGHSSHTKCLETIQFARENFVTMICFPPHCTHRLQPLDVTVMKPLSTYYTENVNTWMSNNRPRVLTEHQIVSCLCPAFERAASKRTIRNGFKKTGIYPFDRTQILESDFAPAEVTDRPLNQQLNESLVSMSPDQEPIIEWEILERSMSNLSVENEDQTESPLRPSRQVILDELGSEDEDLQPTPSCSTSKDLSTSGRKRNRPIIYSSSDDDDNEDAIPIAQSRKRRHAPRKTLVERNIWKRASFEIPPREVVSVAETMTSQSRKRRPGGKTAVLTSDEYCQELRDQRDRAKKKKKQPEAEECESNEDEKCVICGKFDIDSDVSEQCWWIECENCNNWVHAYCAKVSPEDYQGQPYICNNCDQTR